MRKLKLLLVLCMVAIAASASKTMYLAPGPWNASDATERYTLWGWSNDTDGAWYDMTDANNDGIFEVQLPESVAKMIIGRMNNDLAENGWGEVMWNRSDELDAPFADGLTYTITATGDNPSYYISAYLYNPTTGLFLSRGAGYGTAVWADNFGIPVIFIANNGGYRLQYMDQTDQYVSDAYWSWADGGTDRAQTYNVSAAEGGYKLINQTHGDNNLTLYIAEGADDSRYSRQIASNGKYGDNCNENWDVWQFKTSAQREAIVAERKAAAEAAMATSLGYTLSGTLKELVEDVNTFAASNLTSSITNAALTGDYTTGWSYAKKNNGSNPTTNNADGVEVYQGCGTFSQTVTGLTNGLYKVTLQAYYRDGWNNRCSELSNNGWRLSNAYLEANGNQTMIADWASDRADDGNPNSTGQGKALFNAGKYINEVFAIVTDGNLTISIAQPGGATAGRWLFFSNATLTHYSNTVSDEDATAILAQANGIKDSKMGSSVKTALTSAISTFEGSKIIANYNALNTAISNANTSIASYVELQTAITNANNHTIYATAFEAGATTYTNAVTTAQGVYDAAEVDNCADAITALTNGIHAAYESDYSTFVTDYEYDYSTLLSNDLTKWATSNYVVMEGTEHWNGLTNQRYYEQSGADWGSQSWSKNASETATLPAGKYVMSITARASADVTQTMSVKIGNNDALVVSLPHKGSVGRGVTTAGEGSYADDKTYTNNNNGRGWEYRFIAFELIEESPVTISFNSSTEKEHNWCSIAAPLLKGNVHPNQIKLNQVHSLTATLTGYEGSISAETYATFADNIAAAEAATLGSTNLDDIITALEADIETAKAEKVEFDRGAAMNALNTGDNSVVLTEEATAANWTPAPTLNTWSTEADNTGMVKPFLQNWLSAGNALEDKTETYVPIRGLKKGYYEVSALVRIYAENGAEPNATSATFTVNGTSTNLLDGTKFEYNNMKGVYKTARVVVYTEDALNISLAYSGANFNWIAWKDLKVTYLAETNDPVYALVGSGSIFSGNWDQATQTDILTEQSEGVYTKTYVNQPLDAQTIEYKVIKKDFAIATTATNWYPQDNQEVVIPRKGGYDVTFTFTLGDNPTVTGVAVKVSEPVTIGEKGWATTVTNSALNFVSTTVEAYTATVNEAKTTVTLKKVDDVQAETGLVLKGAEGTYYIPVIESSTTDKGSLLASSTNSYWTWHDNGGENNKFYGLTVNNNEAQFALINCSAGNEVEIPAQKAFLLVNSSSAARTLKVVFADDATGINAVVAEESVEGVYNLNGQRVAAPAKGLYIVNGKKVILK